MDSYTYIDTDATLASCAASWMVPELAIDLEMEANFHHYGVHLSLVQISTRERTWLVDMLAIQEPSPIVKMLEDSAILKVFHDVSFDFRILRQVLDCHPKNIFDTKVAAELCGRENVSLGALLEEEFGLQKDADCQKADWMRRPLKQKMLDYAARDTAHLLKLKDILADRLKELGRLQWMQEECRLIEEGDHSNNVPTCQDVKGSKSLSDIERGRLCAMFTIRDELAAKVDKPVFFVIRDKRLIELATRPPRDERQWASLTGVHPIVKRNARKFFQAVEQSQPVKKIIKKRKFRLSQREMEEVDEWARRRDEVAGVLGITNHLVITREQMENLVRTKDDSVLKEWQKKVLSVYS